MQAGAKFFCLALTFPRPCLYKAARDFRLRAGVFFAADDKQERPARTFTNVAASASSTRLDNPEQTREAYLSTVQTRAQAPSRLPLAHGYRRRPQGRGGSPRSRPQAPFRLTQRRRRARPSP